MVFKPEAQYEKEVEFTKHLSNYLDGKKIKRYKRNITKDGENKNEGPISINTVHQETRKTGRTDITIYQDRSQEPLFLNWRSLSNPCIIEGKIGKKFCRKKESIRDQIKKGLNQFLRYKYKKESKKKQELEKYGDYHVLVTCPRFFTSAFNSRDFSGKGISDAILVRFLWQLGIGVLYSNNQTIYGTFNEQEGFYIED